MDKKKHKRIEEAIMKPADLKKARMQRVGPGNLATSSVSGGIKAKLDFRTTSIPTKAPTSSLSMSGSSVAQSATIRPTLDDKWKDFGDTINLNIDTFGKSIIEAAEQEKFNKVARMIVAGLKNFLNTAGLMKIECRILTSIAQVIKSYGEKLNHIAVHRGLLHILSHSRSFTPQWTQAFVAITTCLAKKQEVLDKCYITAFIHDAVGSSSGLGTMNKCYWIDKPYSEELVNMILRPFVTVFPLPEIYASCQLENFGPADYFPKINTAETVESRVQLNVFAEFIVPWFETIRGELIPKSVFRVLGLFCGLEQVRHFVATRLDVWINLQKFHREISELLLILGCNLNASNPMDREVIDILLKMNTKNMKTRTVSTPFSVAIRRACENLVNVKVIFDAVLTNELKNTHNRSPANLPTMHMLLNCQPIPATMNLAMYCSTELLKEKELCLKQLRGFLKELIRSYQSKGGDFELSVFADSFLENISTTLLESETGPDEVVPKMACELLAQIPLLVASAVCASRENAFSPRFNVVQANGEYPEIPTELMVVREKFQEEFHRYCESVLRWLSHEKHVFSSEKIQIECYSLLMYLENKPEVYCSFENAAVQEMEFPNLVRIFGECGISEQMFLMIFGKAHCKLPHFTALEIARMLTHRAAQLQCKAINRPLIKLSEPFKLIERTLQISVYSFLELERIEGAPQICSKVLYWIAWNIIILWLTGGEIPQYFEEIYASYSILRYMITAVMLRKFEFPMDFEGKKKQEVLKNDNEICEKEKQSLSKIEQLMMKPQGYLVKGSYIFTTRECLRAPVNFIELQRNSERYGFASRLSRCNTPPILPQLIATVGAKNALPAVLDILSVDASSVSLLTPECLFYVLVDYHENLKPWRVLSESKKKKDIQATSVLKSIIRRVEREFSSSHDPNNALLSKFLRSLSSLDFSERSAAVATFSMMFPSKTHPFNIEKLASYKQFGSKKSEYLQLIAEAVLREKDDTLAKMYLEFLANNFSKESMHQVARVLCKFVESDRFLLRETICEFFVRYIDSAIEMEKFDKKTKNVPDDMLIFEIATAKVLIYKDVPRAVIRLLSTYHAFPNSKDKKSFESLIELWLSEGALPKIINRDTGKVEKFLTIEMRKVMLISLDQRVIAAAIDNLTEQDAHAFLLVSKMSRETAQKVISKAENLEIEKLGYSALVNVYLTWRGYELKGVRCGEWLEKVKKRLELLKNEVEVANKQKMGAEEIAKILKKPAPFLANAAESVPPKKMIFEDVITKTRMTPADVSSWLKTSTATTGNSKLKTGPPPVFNPPPSFVQSVLFVEQSATACLQHIEANLMFFLNNFSYFENIMVIVDTASYKFENVRKKLETLAVRLLKSVQPPPSISNILKKHAAKSVENRQMETDKNGNYGQMMTLVKLVQSLKSTDDAIKKQNIVSSFMENCVIEKEDCNPEDTLYFLQTLWEIYSGGEVGLTAEKCVSIDWSLKLKRITCKSLLNHYQSSLPAILVFHLLELYCRTYSIASYRELFLLNNNTKNAKLLPNKTAYQSLAFYFSDLANSTKDYDLNIISMITGIEKEGGVESSRCIGEYLLLTSCSHSNGMFREAAKRLLGLLVDRLPYLSYKPGVAASMRVLSNVQTREVCIRKCEQIVDRLIEIKIDADLALEEDICEEEKVAKATPSTNGMNAEEEESKTTTTTGLKRGADNRRGGPPPKKGKWISAREAAIVGGVGGGSVEEAEDNSVKWSSAAADIAQFSSMLREHPNIVKTKFPVLANFVSQMTAMTRRDLKDQYRIKKVELVLNSVITLSSHMKDDEFNSIETALTNCFEFYEKHIEEGIIHIKEQISFSELLIKACASYLNRNTSDARTLLRDNRVLIDRICKRCRDRYDVDLILDNLSQLVA